MKAWDNLKKSFKIVILTVLCITMVFSTGLLCIFSYGASDKSSSKSSQQTEASKKPNEEKKVHEPEINAKSAVLYSENTNTVVFSKNKDERVAPFSTTKLMTALLVVKHIKNLDQKVTISKEAAALGGSSMELKEGEVVTVRQLLYGLMILSGNDAAYSLAEVVSNGNVDEFVKMMNDEAKALGCKDTNFVNPNGMKEENHYTTASDYMKIARAALKNKQVYKFASTKKYEMGATNLTEARVMKSHTDLINTRNSGVVAGKTGFWNGEASIVLAYDKKDLKMVLVLFGDDKENRPKDAKAIFEYAYKYLKVNKPVAKGKKVTKILVRGGKNTIVDAYASETAYAYTEKGDRAKITVKIKRDWSVKAPLRKGDQVAVAKVYVDGKYVSDAPLVVKQNVSKGWITSEAYISNLGAMILGPTLVVLIVIACLVKRRRKKAAVPIGKHDKGRAK